MITDVQEGLDNSAPVRGKLGRERPGETEVPPTQGFQQPPPPPPPPKRRREIARQASTLTSKVPAKTAARFKLLGGVCIVLISAMAVTRCTAKTVDEDAIVTRAADTAVNRVGAYVDDRLAGKTQIAVNVPFSWAKCPLSTEARVMIGGDPKTGGKTLNAERAAPLEQQVTDYLSVFRMIDMRLVATSQSQLEVVTDDPSAGVQLFNCGADFVEQPPVTTTAPAS